VPWVFNNRWLNCLKLTRNINFVVSRIFREGNQCADGLANIGLNIDRFTIWYDIPTQIRSCFEIPLRVKTTFHVGSRPDVKIIDVVSEGIPRRFVLNSTWNVNLLSTKVSIVFIVSTGTGAISVPFNNWYNFKYTNYKIV
jgi:hypothetical protein